MADSKAVAERIEQKLDDQIKSYKSRANITAIIGVVLGIVIIGYFTFISGLIKQMMVPEEVAGIALTPVEARFPELREQIALELQNNAEEVSDEVINTLLRRVPEIRREIVAFTDGRLDLILERVRQDILDVTRLTLDDHKAKIDEMLPYLESDQSARVFEEEMYQMLIDTIQAMPAKSELDAYGITLGGISDRAEFLLTADGLTESQQMEREILFILKELSVRSN